MLPLVSAGAGETDEFIKPRVIAATLVGRLAELGWDRKLRGSVAAMVIGNVVIFAIGVTWLAIAAHLRGQDVLVVPTSLSPITVNYPTTSTPALNYLTVDNSGGGGITLNLTGGTLAAASSYIGIVADATVSNTGATHSVGGLLSLGRRAGSSGTYNLSGTATLSTLQQYLGELGAAGTGGHLGQQRQVDVVAERLALGVHAEDLQATLLRG